jgi:hypothetical protein
LRPDILLRQPFTAKADARKGRIVAIEARHMGPGSAPRQTSRSMVPGTEGRGRTEATEGRSEFADCDEKSRRQISVALSLHDTVELLKSGEERKKPIRREFDSSIMMDFRAAKITSDRHFLITTADR